MTYKNFETHPIALTILTPIHIGCGEDYEPTNFVADTVEKRLYSFDPFLVKLTEKQKRGLAKVANSGSIRDIYKFYLENKALYKVFSKAVVPFDDRISKNIESLLDPNKDLNRNRIERFCYCETEELQVPYIPGSCIKGAIHTALLDRLSSEDPSVIGRINSKRTDIDEEVLGGRMNKSPMKLLSISDLHADDPYRVKQKIILASRVHKKEALEGNPTGVPSAFEVLQRAQFRCFTGTFTKKNKDPRDKEVQNDYRQYQDAFKDLNRYSLKEFRDEYQYWVKSGHIGAPWMSKINSLLEQLKPQLDQGSVALIRLGKNCGARNLTLRTDGAPQIKIRGPKGSKPRFLPDSTTMFVAMEEGHGYPFGWALLEFTEISDGKPIEEWARRVNEGIRSLDLKALREEFLKEKDRLIKEYEKDQFRIEENRKAEQAKALEEQKRREEMDRLTEERRSVVELKEKIQATSQVAPGTALYKEFVELLTKATAWQAADKVFLAEAFAPLVKKKGLDAGKKGKEIKNTLKTYKEAK